MRSSYTPGCVPDDPRQLIAFLRSELNALTQALERDSVDFTGGTSRAGRLKYKLLTGTTGAAEGGQVTAAHGLDVTKIRAVDVLVTNGSGQLIPPENNYSTENQYSLLIGTVSVVILNHATNSGNILSKAFTALITYEG